ncbi:DinB family protein [Streptomyces verrucosisporus]|uniref:DinB family protein n=1 Tax=Streptomyces verrucosisporus TaxID=1695161 RepID=UPI0019D04BAC|nr:DinB family protein [Streptomyces verrucosisporus]MBN3929544.1 DinB family protein [Streptomyces verrucosisporus]
MTETTDTADAADTGGAASAVEGSRGDVRPPEVEAGERTTLLAFLDYLRDAVAAKAAGVPDEAARAAGVPSGTSLLGLVKHLTAVEHNWFTWAFAGEGDTPADDGAPPAPGETAGEILRAYREAAGRSNAIAAACDRLDRPGVRSLRETPPPTMRWILVHMIEETARHAGHADILREHIDGSAGR